MLNQDSLTQLKGLKQQMEAEKERAEAVIKGTQARYGFAVLDDGREIRAERVISAAIIRSGMSAIWSSG